MTKRVAWNKKNHEQFLQDLDNIKFLEHINVLSKYKNVQKSWDEKHQKFIDFSKEMDIVCSANPYDGMTHKLYRIGKLSKKDILPIYFNYGYPAVLWARRVAALDSLSKMWKVFSESPATMEEYSNSMKTHGENLVLAGYMKMDNLAKQPIRKRERKTIIIAPLK